MNKDNDIVEVEYTEENNNLPSTIVNNFTQADVEFEFARSNIINILQTSNLVLQNTADLAVESDHPKMIEVYSDLIKSLADINLTLFTIREKKMKIKGELMDADEVPTGTTINNNAIFVGTSEELLAKLNG